MPTALPPAIPDIDALNELLSRPTAEVVQTLRRIRGDVILLGAAGKMGPTLARMLRRAADEADVDSLAPPRRIIAVARFSDASVRKRLAGWNIETIQADLLDPAQLAALPDAPNVIYMPAMKFGATGQEARTWAINAFLPGLVCRRYAGSRIVAFSTGNIYGLSPVAAGGSSETDELRPAGDYAMSCLGRERIFEHFSREAGTRVAIERLYYAVEMRYGVLRDIADRVWNRMPIDLSMGHLNLIWQGDANAFTIRLLEHVASPPFALNVTSRPIHAIRDLAEQFAQLFDRPPVFAGRETGDALIANASQCAQLFGPPTVDLQTLIRWTADWVKRGGASLNKPTHFEATDGKY